ncbi:MAG: TRAP transporter large permease subunit, partial [Acetobacteraceae bacterium]|nr:TRAP transporter large permease subunit [Acetobacteraceae bacterium]
MSNQDHHLPPEAAELDDRTAAKVEELIEQEEGAQNRFRGLLAILATLIAVGMSSFHLYAAIDIVPTMYMRYTHVGFVLVLTFLMFPMARRFRNRLMPWDIVLIAGAIWVMHYIITGGDELTDRYVFPEPMDIWIGWGLIILTLEATRRTTGWIMPAISIAFMLYAFFGNHLPAPWTHQGYDAERLIPHLTITLDGIFGTAVDVSSSLIILFTIFGAVLQVTGAGKFFVDFSFALMGG